MSKIIEPISDIDLNAYVDDQLDMARRIEVEAHLAKNPLVAARVMADLRTRDALRLSLLTTLPSLDEKTLHAAQSLQRGLLFARVPRWVGAAAALLVLIGGGWFFAGSGNNAIFTPASNHTLSSPAFLEEAVMSHYAALVRARMQSQPESTFLDPAEIRAETQISIPSLPVSWRILDVQVFPSDNGLSVQITLDTDAHKALSLFAIHRGIPAFIKPTLAKVGTESVAYWTEGAMGYALTGSLAMEDLKRVADDLADNPVL